MLPVHGWMFTDFALPALCGVVYDFALNYQTGRCSFLAIHVAKCRSTISTPTHRPLSNRGERFGGFRTPPTALHSIHFWHNPLPWFVLVVGVLLDSAASILQNSAVFVVIFSVFDRLCLQKLKVAILVVLNVGWMCATQLLGTISRLANGTLSWTPLRTTGLTTPIQMTCRQQQTQHRGPDRN